VKRLFDLNITTFFFVTQIYSIIKYKMKIAVVGATGMVEVIQVLAERNFYRMLMN
jgi:hypothetical protein